MDSVVYSSMNDTPPLSAHTPKLVRQCMSLMFDQRHFKAEDARSLLDKVPNTFHQRTYEVQETVTCCFRPRCRIPRALIKPSFMLFKPIRMTTTSFEEYICSGFDLTLCGVWLHVTEEQQFQTFTLPDADKALNDKEIQFRGVSFSPTTRNIDIEPAVGETLLRVQTFTKR